MNLLTASAILRPGRRMVILYNSGTERRTKTVTGIRNDDVVKHKLLNRKHRVEYFCMRATHSVSLTMFPAVVVYALEKDQSIDGWLM